MKQPDEPEHVMQPPPVVRQAPPVQTGPLNVDDMVIPTMQAGAGAN